MTREMEELKLRLRTTWMSGDYDRFCRYMEPGAREYFKGLGIVPGTKMLDVACGAGQLALIAARAGAEVTGCDIASNWIGAARARAEAEGLNAAFEVADAEELPYGNNEFDAVTSLVGAMFAPRPDKVAAELLRVCRPGGRICLANWTPAGFIGKMFRTIAGYIQPNGMPSPLLWGDEETVRKRMGKGLLALTCTRRLYPFVYPFGPAEVVDFFRENYGPMTRAFTALPEDARQSLQRELTGLWAANNQAAGGTTAVQSEYLDIVAVRL